MQLLSRKNKALFFADYDLSLHQGGCDAREMTNFEADTNFTFSAQNMGDTELEEEVSLTGAGYSFVDLVPEK